MPTDLLFRDDAYLTETAAIVVGVNERGGIILDKTVFYATGGGQPGDKGTLITAAGVEIPVATTVYGEDKTEIVHVPAEGSALPTVGDKVTARIDWDTRLKRMRIHTALHLLTTVLPYPVTGGAIGDGEGRLDFDIPDAGLEKEAIAEELMRRINQNADVTEQWITDAELEANPGLVKTMSVKPPMGSGRVRLVNIVGLDLQPCGGTHVKNTREIGNVAVTNIEKKGKQNRRVRIALV
ncbi:MAG: alanyl-tRNA editing protein [Beijerinckiaceae bacterium]|nr:alanyl-tRNA editing protein [Beijerinckiaceae bacterium]